jgi:hypothetical protein
MVAKAAFIEGLSKRLGEHAANLIWAAVLCGSAMLAWFSAPTTYTLKLSRFEIAVCVLIAMGVLAFTAWLTRHFAQRHRAKPKPLAPIDELQRDILRIMWHIEGGVLQFEQLQRILLKQSNYILVACQHLQERGFIACNIYTPNPLIQLLPEGREFAKDNQLTDASELIKLAAAHSELP